MKEFKPSKEFSNNALIKTAAQYKKIRLQALKSPTAFWSTQAKELHWQKPFKKVLDWKFPFAKWFIGGKLNACENAIDVHVNSGLRNKAAIIWESESGEVLTLTYQQVSLQVNQLANALKSLGRKKRRRRWNLSRNGP